MKKLSLDLEMLAVESFATDAEPARPAGTVRANALEQADPTVMVETPQTAKSCPPYFTCTCNDSDCTYCYSCNFTACFTLLPCCMIP